MLSCMPSEEEQIINLIAQELSAGKSVDAVAGELMQAGLPRNEAYTVVNAVAQQLARRGGGRGGRGRAPPMRRPSGTNWGMWIMILAILFLLYIIFFQ